MPKGAKTPAQPLCVACNLRIGMAAAEEIELPDGAKVKVHSRAEANRYCWERQATLSAKRAEEISAYRSRPLSPVVVPPSLLVGNIRAEAQAS